MLLENTKCVHTFSYRVYIDVLLLQLFRKSALFGRNCVRLIQFTVTSFLVGAFSFKEKSPTITVASFFSSDHRPHRVCTTFYRLHVSTHSRVLVSARFTVNPTVTGSSPCFSQKLFRAIFFPISFVAKGSPFKFFDILQQAEVSKSPKGPPF